MEIEYIGFLSQPGRGVPAAEIKICYYSPMHTLSTFFITLYRSVTDLNFYKTFKKKFWSGFWYIYWLSALLIFVSGVNFAVRAGSVVLKVDQALDVARKSMDQFYPADLEVSIISGSLVTNVQTPYALDIPQVAVDAWDIEDTDQHLVLIDPGASAEDYPSKNTMILLTAKSVVYPDSNSQKDGESTGRYRVASLKDVNKLEINRAVYEEGVAKLESFFPLVKPVIIVAMVLGITVLPFVGAFFGVLGQLFGLVFSSFFLWILAAILRVPGGYGRVYVLSMYALTGSAVYGTLESVFEFHISWIAGLLFWGWMIVILVALRPREKAGKVAAVKSRAVKKVR